MSKIKKALLVLGALLLCLVLGLVAIVFASSEDKPVGEAGPAAEALAQKMMTSTGAEAWAKTGAVSWDFGGRNQHLWDRARGFARVRWDGGQMEALIDLRSREGQVKRGGALVEGEEAKALLEKAWGMWVNDSFWLNPIPKAYDPGVVRKLVKLDGGGEGLLVSYEGEGGVTPGDAYLWVIGEDGKPTSWKMWVTIIPVGGVESSWEGWTTLSTGAVVATRHKMGPITLELTQIKAGATAAEVDGGEDPFRPLVQARGGDGEEAPASSPSSR